MCKKWNEDNDLRIVEFSYTYVTLNRDQFFPGYCFVFAKKHVTELFHLDPPIRASIIEDVNTVAKALFTTFQPSKINYELLGNMVPHMHWHIVPRFMDDPLWPRPIWSEPHTSVGLPADQIATRIALIRQAISQ
jgi:diadenosine tetraphosphate (Ap4A) HIT family hydrolase